MFIERIVNGGEYRPLEWKNRHGYLEDGVRKPCNWNSSKQVSDLNTWRRQVVRRTMRKLSKPRSVPFTEAENDWLYDRYKAAYAVQGVFGKRVQTDMNQLAADFNAAFQGTVPSGADAPRPQRTSAALNTHLQRVPRNCSEFGLQLHYAHKKRGSQSADKSAVEEDAIDEDGSLADGEQSDEDEAGSLGTEQANPRRKRDRFNLDDDATTQPSTKRGKGAPEAKERWRIP